MAAVGLGLLAPNTEFFYFDSHDFLGLGNQSCETFLVKAFLIVTSFRNSFRNSSSGIPCLDHVHYFYSFLQGQSEIILTQILMSNLTEKEYFSERE